MKEDISKYLTNDELDIEKIIKGYKNYINTIIVKDSTGCLNSADMEEVLSDVFFNIWHNRQRVKESDCLKNYIIGITKNATRAKMREKLKSTKEVELSDELSDDLTDLELIYDNEKIVQIIKEELGNFEKEDYDIFSKFYYEEKNIKEIANETGLSEVNVRVKLHRTRKKLKENLEKRGINYFTVIIIIFALLFTGFVFGREIVKIINRFFADTSEGEEVAVENGYVQEVIDDYTYSNGVGIKIDSVLMDDYNLSINFSIKIDDMEDLSSVSSCKFPNLLITDENNNLIVAKFDDPEYSALAEIIADKDSNRYLGINNGSESSHITSKSGNEFVFSYTTHSDEFPVSEKLIIQFDKIILYESDDNLGKVSSQIKGNWQIKVDLPEEFSNRQTIVYTLKSSNMENLEVTKANLSATGFKMAFSTTWGDKYYQEGDTKEEFENRLNEMVSESIEEGKLGKYIPIDEGYVQDENGNRYYPAGVSDGDGFTGLSPGGNMEYEGLYNYTMYDYTDTIWVIFEKNEECYDISQEPYIIIELERNGN